MGSIAEDLAGYVSSMGFGDLDERTIHSAKRLMIDDIGCAIAASRSLPARIAMASIQDTKGPKAATILGTRRKTDPSLAAFINGAMARYLDYNDTYDSKELSHPSDNIMPIIAVAEAFGKSGKDAILGIVLAYELQCRLCDAANLWKLGWDHVIYGLISVSGASSRIMGIGTKKTTQAINIALNSHLTMRQLRSGEISMWKAPAFSNSARNAIFAATLAGNGMTGPAPVFEGAMGFWKEVSGRFSVDTRKFGGRRGRFKINDTLIKYFPAEVRSQTTIFAALEARKHIGSIADIKSIEIGTNEAGWKIIGRDPEKWDPKTKETADHSLPYVVAVALMDGNVTPESYLEKRFRDGKTLKLMKSITVVERRKYTEMFDKGGTVNASDVVIKLKDGRTIRKGIIYSKGHPKNPMNDSDVEEKFRKLVRNRISAAKADMLIDTIWNLERLKDIRRLVSIV
ncbi:MAG: MmgE/PrpD family protein [Candidatus Micrarchaeaceae archaeon]